ncbi:MAG: aldehyde:ferredoxin oxidoreductase [Coprothermobacterota bacterium]|nr:aldehyde:ferredoxin oxidoreductase [Coprothermobacterota bacterium]
MSAVDSQALKSQHKLLAEYNYQLRPVERGYNNRTLFIDLGSKEIAEKPVCFEMKRKFVGGKGFDLRLLWDAVQETTRWDDPENEIVISMGPICGNTNYPGSGKSIVATLSPETKIPVDCNVGGYFGPYLKLSGFDALEISGKAQQDVIVFIDGDKGKIQIIEAPGEAVDSHVLAEELLPQFAALEKDKQHYSFVTAGRGGDHTRIGCLNFSFYDKRRKVMRFKQAGRGGTGTVFRDKRIKALVVKFSRLTGASNNPVDLKKVQDLGLKMHHEILSQDDQQCRMRQVGTAHLVEIMNDYDLLPVHNFKFGMHPQAEKLSSHEFKKWFTQGMPDGCWFGCTLACCKAADNFELLSGPYRGQRVVVDGPEYETVAGVGSNSGIFDARSVIEINFYCDTYGLDTISFGTITAFLMECYEVGILNKERTGGLELTWGNTPAVLEMLHQMASGEGFGAEVASKGVRWMKDAFATQYSADRQFLEDIGMEGKGLEQSQYMSKESLAQQGGYYMTNKGPQHDEAWLIFMDMVNNAIPTFQDKADALHYFPMFRTWFSLQGLCKLPWNDIEPADNATTEAPSKVPEHVANYIELYTAITGFPLDKEELIRQSERVYNFQRIFNLRMGGGSRGEDRAPYRAVGPVTMEEYESRRERYDKQLKEKMGVDPDGLSLEEKLRLHRVYREEQYNKLQDAVYARRGWTTDAIPTVEHLRDLGMDLPELVEVVKKHLP